MLVPAFTDLKRHKMGDLLDNEELIQDGVPTDEWLTRKLWGFASEPPFLHHGRATLISEAILAHGGEAQEARDRFAALTKDEQATVVEFLKTLQVLPEGADSLVIVEGSSGSGGVGLLPIIGGGAGILVLLLATGAVLWAWRR